MSQELTFGGWLRQRRTELGITRDELSERVGFSLDLLRKLESGERRPSGQIAYLLADYFRIPADEREAFVTFARSGRAAADDANAAAPWRSTYVRHTNLPTLLTSLVGRIEEEAAAREHLLNPKTRLLTLTGAPGIGKTRLALQVASDLVADFADGVFFVDLSSITDPGLVLPAVVVRLGLEEAAEQSIEQVLLDYVRDKRALLVLDNFEQVLDAAPQVVKLLEASPWLKVLVTSREPLRVRGERRYAVPPLRTPDLGVATRLEAVAAYPAVELFVERAQEAAPDFALASTNVGEVAVVCVKLEGLPLAIELAASRAGQLTPAQMRAGLADRLGLLAGEVRDLPPRHRTLHAAIEWSYNLLDEAEQRIFRRLGVFVDGFTSEAAGAVAGSDERSATPDVLLSLVSKNLVRQERLGSETGEAGGAAGIRFGMLETIREYALERLSQTDISDGEETRRRHAAFFVSLAEQAEPELLGSDQALWLARLEREYGNIRAALEWASDRDPEVAVGTLFALKRFWHIRSHFGEGGNWLEKILARGSELPAIVRAKALRVAAQFAHNGGKADQAVAYLEEAETFVRQTADKGGTSHVLGQLGFYLLEQGDNARAKALFEECLVLDRERGDKNGVCWLDTALGELARLEGDYAQARAYYEEGLVLAREAGNKYNISFLVYNSGMVALAEGDYRRAVPLLVESLTLTREIGYEPGYAECLAGFVGVAVAQGRPERAAKLSGAVEHLFEVMDAGLEAADSHAYEGYVAAARGQLTEEAWEAARAQGQAMSMDEAIENALEHLNI